MQRMQERSRYAGTGKGVDARVCGWLGSHRWSVPGVVRVAEARSVLRCSTSSFFLLRSSSSAQ